MQSIRILLPEPEKVARLYFALIDLTDSNLLNITNDDIQLVVEEDRKLNRFLSPGFAVAIVAARDAHFGLARMWQTYVESTGWDTTILRNVEEAETWLKQMALRNHATTLPNFMDELAQVRK